MKAVTIIVLAALSSIAFGQNLPTGLRGYKTQEDYCRDNPKMPTCIKMGPIDLRQITGGGLYKPPVQRTTPSQPRTEAAPRGEVMLQDWRFSHAGPALLVSVNIASLLSSPIWTTVLSPWAEAAQIEKARGALSDVGQILVSVNPNGVLGSSVLILAKGDLDGPLGRSLRSGGGMQARRLDAITMLIGDTHSLELASVRMRSPFARTTSNALQLTASQEAMKYDAWIGIDPGSLSSVASALGAKPNPAFRALANLRALSVGIYLRDQIRIEALVDAPSPDVADRMLAAYRKSEAKQPHAGQVWVTVDGTKLRYIEIVEASQLKKSPLFDDDTAQVLGPKIPALIQALAGMGSARPAAVAAPPSPGGIVIHGLDPR